MVRIRRLVPLVVIAVGLGLVAPAGAAAEPTLNIARRTQLVEGGAAVVVFLRASCPAGLDVLEAFVIVTQKGASSDMTGFPLTCTGTLQRFHVRVPALEGSFHRGPAGGSGLVLVIDEDSQQTQQAQDSEELFIRRLPPPPPG